MSPVYSESLGRKGSNFPRQMFNFADKHNIYLVFLLYIYMRYQVIVHTVYGGDDCAQRPYGARDHACLVYVLGMHFTQEPHPQA